MIESEHLKHAALAHGFFTRGGGHSTGIFASLNCGLGSGDDPELVAKNREIAARQLGVEPQRLVSAWQVHSADVADVTEPWAQDQRPKVDAMVTATKDIAIGVLTADCAPILFADAEAGVIGAAHAGWKGALAGVALATVQAMERHGASRERIMAVIGPTISKANYEVGPAFPDAFIKAHPEAARFFKPSLKQDHHLFDLPGFLLWRMKQDGIGTVINLDLCTYADEARFYSYRRATHRGETDYGRLISAIALT
jgi:YfiH family protein